VDLERAVDFYENDLGLPLVARWPDREAVWLMAGERTRIGLWRPQVGLAGGRGGGHRPLAPPRGDAAYDAPAPPRPRRGHEVEEHVFETDPHSRAAYVTDPDGNVVELWTWDVAGHLQERP